MLDCFDITNVRSFGIEACGSFRSTLSQKIPALVQIFINFTHPLALGIGGGTLSFLPEELVLLMHELVHPLSKVLIFHSLPYQSTEILMTVCKGETCRWMEQGPGESFPRPPSRA